MATQSCILGASLGVQSVKNPSAVQETCSGLLGGTIPWSRAWQPTPVFLPGKSHGHRSLVGCSPWGHRVRHDWDSQWWEMQEVWLVHYFLSIQFTDIQTQMAVATWHSQLLHPTVKGPAVLKKKKKNSVPQPSAPVYSCPLHTSSWYSVLSQTLATQINLASSLLCWGVIKLFTASQIETCNAVSLWNLKEIEYHQLCGLNTLAKTNLCD